MHHAVNKSTDTSAVTITPIAIPRMTIPMLLLSLISFVNSIVIHAIKNPCAKEKMKVCQMSPFQHEASRVEMAKPMVISIRK